MREKDIAVRKGTEVAQKGDEEKIDSGLFLKFSSEIDEKTGTKGPSDISFSDGSLICKETAEEFRTVLKKTTGTDNVDQALAILRSTSRGLAGSYDDRMNHVAKLLPCLGPKDEMESMLIGQYLALTEAGNRCLRELHCQDGFYHLERFTMLATKLFGQANATIQALMKYRSGGQQTVQVLHVHNEGQAIVAQNLSQSKME